ncbi:MAG TPA: nitrilase family protein [Bacteroidales bacterium]|nr:nitrilase family protein [Bacteroidales bacterium]
MDTIRISTVQFENRSNDKEYNLSVIDEFAGKAAREGSGIVAFHECSVCGYSFARKLTSEQMLGLSEHIPGGPSVTRLHEIAAKHNIVILSGLFEKDDEGRIFKAQVCVGKNGLIARHRKLHPFIHPAIRPGDSYTLFEIDGWKCGILICYDNNIIENVRAVRLLGAEIIFMPHVTMCTPSPRPGAGFVDPELWYHRDTRAEELRAEFDGAKGRGWLMKWLPSRAYDNSVYVVFSNPIGMDDDQLKNGCSMILDPFGDIMAECRKLDNDIVSATLTRDKLSQGGGYRYIKARRPRLYRDIIGKDHAPEQKVAWMK